MTPDYALYRIVHRFTCTLTLGTKPNVVAVVSLNSLATAAVLRAFYLYEKKLLKDPEYGAKYHEEIMKNSTIGFARKP